MHEKHRCLIDKPISDGVRSPWNLNHKRESMSRPIGDVNGTSRSCKRKWICATTKHTALVTPCSAVQLQPICFICRTSRKEKARAKRDAFAFFIDGVVWLSRAFVMSFSSFVFLKKKLEIDANHDDDERCCVVKLILRMWVQQRDLKIKFESIIMKEQSEKFRVSNRRTYFPRQMVSNHKL